MAAKRKTTKKTAAKKATKKKTAKKKAANSGLKLKWSKPSEEAYATILFPPDELNFPIITNLYPAGDDSKLESGIIGDLPTHDDYIDITSFHGALTKIKTPADRVIQVHLRHAKKKRTLELKFIFINGDQEVEIPLKIETKISGTTRFNVLVAV